MKSSSFCRYEVMVTVRFSLMGAILILGGLSSFFAGSSWARQDIVPGSRYTSARAAAMSDAYLPLGDDGPSGLFYNPATLGRIRNPQFEGLNLSLYANSGYAGMFNIDFYNVASLSGYLKTLEKNPGTFAGAGFSVIPSAYMRGFAFGVLLQSHLGAVANGDGTVRYRSVYQFVPTVGTGIRLAGGIVRLGYSLQWVNQASGDFTVLTSDTPLGYNQGLAQGSGISHNLGFSLTLPIAYLPSLNLVGRNLFGVRFGTFSLLPLARNSIGAPANEPASYDASFSIQPKVGGGSYFNFVLEYRDIFNQSKVSALGRAVFGAELSLKDHFYLRGGWGSGYPSAGIGLKRKGGEFALSWYSEELGIGYHSLRDVRYMLQYQVRAF